MCDTSELEESALATPTLKVGCSDSFTDGQGMVSVHFRQSVVVKYSKPSPWLLILSVT